MSKTFEGNGGDLPPIGEVYQHRNHNPGWKYEVTGYIDQDTEQSETFRFTIVVVYRNIETGKVWCKPLKEWKKSFKPVRTDREKWVDEANQMLKEIPCGYDPLPYFYDAMKSGKLPKVGE